MSHSPNLNQLKAFSVGGFRSISSENPVTIEFHGVTALCGLNSSGKSSALYALRLLAQSLEREPYAAQLHLVGSLANRSEFRTPESLFHQSDSTPRILFRMVTKANDGWDNHEFVYGPPVKQGVGESVLPLVSFRRFHLSGKESEVPDPWGEIWDDGCSQEICRVDGRELFSRVIEEAAIGLRKAGLSESQGAMDIWNASLAVPEKRKWLSLPAPGDSAQREFAELYEKLESKAEGKWDRESTPSLVGLDSSGSREIMDYPWLQCLAGWSDRDETDEFGQGPGPCGFNKEAKEIFWQYFPKRRKVDSWAQTDNYCRDEENRICLKDVVVEYRRWLGDRNDAVERLRKDFEENGYGQGFETAMFALFHVRIHERYMEWCGGNLSAHSQELLTMSNCIVPDYLSDLQELAPVFWMSYLHSGYPIDFGANISHEKEKLKLLLHEQPSGIPPLGLFFPVKENLFRRAVGILPSVSEADRGSEESAIALSLGSVVRSLDQSISLVAAPGIRNPLEGERGQDASLIAQLANMEGNPCQLPLPGEKTKDLPTVLEALNAWLDYLGITEVHHFEQDQRGGTFAVMKIGKSGEPGMLLDDQGEGARQVIYILIQAILARPGDILVWQQPEVHLHPAAEARMAEFALALESAGMRVLVETHSTHLLDGLRLGVLERRIEIQRTSAKAEASAFPALDILFFSVEDGCSQVQKVRLDKYGQIVNWPVGFLDERQDLDRRLLESYILAQRLDSSSDQGQG